MLPCIIFQNGYYSGPFPVSFPIFQIFQLPHMQQHKVCYCPFITCL